MYSFLKGQISQRKNVYPNSSCTCQLSIIKIPYRKRYFISFIPKPSALLDALVIQKFQSTMSIRGGRSPLLPPHPPGIAESHNWQNTPALHRCRCLGSPRAPRATRAALPSRPTIAQHRGRPRLRRTRPARLGEPPTGPDPPPWRESARRSGSRKLPLPERQPGLPRGLPHPSAAAELTHLERRGAGAGREAGSGSGSAGASFPLAGQGAPRLSRHRDTASCISAAAPPSRQAPAHSRTFAKVLQAAGSGPPPPARRSPAPPRGARAPPPAARSRGPARRPLRRRGSAPPAQPLPPRPARTGGQPRGPGSHSPSPGCGGTGGAPVSAAETPAARDRAVRLPPRGKSYREVSPQI